MPVLFYFSLLHVVFHLNVFLRWPSLPSQTNPWPNLAKAGHALSMMGGRLPSRVFFPIISHKTLTRSWRPKVTETLGLLYKQTSPPKVHHFSTRSYTNTILLQYLYVVQYKTMRSTKCWHGMRAHTSSVLAKNKENPLIPCFSSPFLLIFLLANHHHQLFTTPQHRPCPLARSKQHQPPLLFLRKAKHPSFSHFSLLFCLLSLFSLSLFLSSPMVSSTKSLFPMDSS